MLFATFGDSRNPAVLFFHAMGVTGASSEPVAKHLCDAYFCVLPTSTVYCAGQTYRGKVNEVRQVEAFLCKQGVMKAYPHGNYPILEGYNHMQYQIRDPRGFAEMLRSIMEKNALPPLPFLKG